MALLGGIVLDQNGARSVTMRVSKAILAQVEVARGSQRLSTHRFLKRFSSLGACYWVLLYVVL